MTRSLVVRRLATGGIVCALCFGWAWWIERPFAVPVLQVPLPPVDARPIDTVLVLRDAGRYELVLDLTVEPGEVRGPLMDAGPMLDFVATIGTVTARTGDDGPNGTYGSSSSIGFMPATLRAERGDTLRLRVRSLDSLDARRALSPTVIVRRHYLEALSAMYREGGLQLLGLLALVIGAGGALVAVWRARASGQGTVSP